jgi:two-component system chemotaxis response regulator CheB
MSSIERLSIDDRHPRSAQAPIDVMVVDDSAVIRGLITRMLEAEDGITVVASASNGEHAIREIKRRTVDVVVLDIEMPVMDGLTAIPGLLEADPHAKILIASTLSTKNAEISFRALQAGAADYLPKPTSNRDIIGGTNGGLEFRDELVNKVRSLGETTQRRRRGDRPGAAAAVTLPRAEKIQLARQRIFPGVAPTVLAIGSSTGGPQALIKLLKALGSGFPLPVLITQHMPPAFTGILATHLNSQTGLNCSEARDGDQLEPSHAYIAPGTAHMTVRRGATSAFIKLDDGPPENFCRPSVDPMFRSVARCFGARTLAVVLTGMGADGSRGGKDIFTAGGTVIAQDEATSVVWGMPGAAAAAGICSAILPLDQIAPWVLNTTTRTVQ